MSNLDGNYNFTWSRTVVDGLKKQLGTYVGEMFMGYIGMSNAAQGHLSQNILPNNNKCFLGLMIHSLGGYVPPVFKGRWHTHLIQVW